MNICINAYREQTCYILTEGRGKRHGYKTGDNERPMQTDKFHVGGTEEPKKHEKGKAIIRDIMKENVPNV